MFREAIEKQMRAAGMSQAELSRQVGVHPTTINRWLRGVSDLSGEHLEAAIKALGGASLAWGDARGKRAG
jgi:transcriptional regulator with XRE-family HTH domain